jgi:hypothetical protein
MKGTADRIRLAVTNVEDDATISANACRLGCRLLRCRLLTGVKLLSKMRRWVSVSFL